MTGKIFNVNGDCRSELHYMVDISDRLRQIKDMVDKGQYFTINRARQYGKTTTLQSLGEYLKHDYSVVSLDFQMMSASKFKNENTFSIAFSRIFIKAMETENPASTQILQPLKEEIEKNKDEIELLELFECLSEICGRSSKPVVLIIDEVDSAANNQVFLDFLAQLRGYYLKRCTVPTFRSVILAGVYDVKNIKMKLRAEEEQKVNSPWNIAADFLVDMSFSVTDIAGMLGEYEKDHHTGMNIPEMAGMLYDYTSGYPFLVSRLCKLIDERVTESEMFPDKTAAWCRQGFLKAVKMLLEEKNTLFESLMNKVNDLSELRKILYALLFTGNGIPYNPLNKSIEIAEMFGFVKNLDGNTVISNRIFEMLLYNFFLSEELVTSKVYDVGLREKNQFLCGGHLNMRLILEKFVVHFNALYGDMEEEFLEEAGRRYFLLYLKPIINGAGNYYIEAETRNRERTDVIIDYLGEQYVVEMKIWRGEAYHSRGEEQLLGYLDYYHLKKGYMLSFNFNKKKEIGVKEIVIGDKVLIEAVV